MLARLWNDESGLTSVEYALLLFLVAVGGIVAWQTLAGSTHGQVDEVSTQWPEG